MSERSPAHANLWRLIDAELDGSITAEQSAELHRSLETDLDACRIYGGAARIEAELHLLMRGRAANAAVVGRSWRIHNDECRLTKDECETDMDRGGSSMGRSSFSIQHSESPSPLPPVIIQTLPSPLSALPSFIGSPLFSYIAALVIVGLGLAIGARVHVSQYADSPDSVQNPVPQSPVPNPTSIVGRITGMVDCEWEKGAGDASLPSPARGRGAGGEGGLYSGSVGKSLSAQSLVSLGDRLALRSGLLELTYDTGAKVILQGPVTYEVESPAGGYLSIGKLTAKLEKKSEVRGQRSESANQKAEIRNRNSSDLFAIRTPTALVTDLGTEFGVEVDKQGGTASHVFRGSVRVQVLPSNGQAAGQQRVLYENQSVRVDEQGHDQSSRHIRMNDSPAQPVHFVRELPKPSIKTFDLVDVVAGGDGFSGRRNAGIDPLTGRIVDTLDTKAKKPWSADGQYHRVPQRPLVDGVFVPNGENGPVQVSSAGHLFDGFLKTSHETWQYIWAGGPLTTDHVPTLLGGVDYAASGHGLLYFNGNSAITFDLQAIRRANPGSTLLRFRAVAGNVSPIGVADIRVLVDGRQWFQRWQINGQSGAFVVVVPIADHDRFLTLATTDGGDGISGDWLIFGDPCLELTTVETPTRAPAAQTAIIH